MQEYRLRLLLLDRSGSGGGGGGGGSGGPGLTAAAAAASHSAITSPPPEDRANRRYYIFSALACENANIGFYLQNCNYERAYPQPAAVLPLPALERRGPRCDLRRRGARIRRPGRVVSQHTIKRSHAAAADGQTVQRTPFQLHSRRGQQRRQPGQRCSRHVPFDFRTGLCQVRHRIALRPPTVAPDV